MRTLILLTAVTTLMAAGAAFAIKSFTPDTVAVAAPQAVTISIDHRQEEVRSLTELKFEELYPPVGWPSP